MTLFEVVEEGNINILAQGDPWAIVDYLKDNNIMPDKATNIYVAMSKNGKTAVVSHSNFIAMTAVVMLGGDFI